MLPDIVAPFVLYRHALSYPQFVFEAKFILLQRCHSRGFGSYRFESLRASTVVYMDDNGDSGDVDFQQKLAKFEAADERFRVLSDALEAYRDAITAVTDTGVAVADALASFFDNASVSNVSGSSATVTTSLNGQTTFSASNKTPAADALDSSMSANLAITIPVAFRSAQSAIQRIWSRKMLQKFDSDVYKGVRDSLNQFPQVRNYVKQRSTAHQEMLKRQKKLKDAGTRGRDKQRKWRECSDRFKMFDDEVTQRFSNIDRAQHGLVTKPLRLLVSLLDEFSRDSAAAFHEVAALLRTPAPAITREFEPPPRHDPLVGSISTVLPDGVKDEGWDDDFDFRNSDAAHEAFQDLATLSAEHDGDVKPAAHRESLGATHTRTRSAMAVPPRLVASDTGTRRAASGPPSTLSRYIAADQETASHASDDIRKRNSSSPYVEQLTPNALAAMVADEARVSGDGAQSQSMAGSGRDAAWDQESRSEKDKVLMRLAATFDFTPKETNELALRKGNIIEIYEQHASGWWLGRTNHITGYFPRNHARTISEEEELEFISERARRRRERRRGHRRRDSLTASQSSIGASASGANE